jgi:hypothetical protein
VLPGSIKAISTWKDTNAFKKAVRHTRKEFARQAGEKPREQPGNAPKSIRDYPEQTPHAERKICVSMRKKWDR